MISGAVLIIVSVLLLLYCLISKSQSMIELRSMIKNSIFVHKIVDLLPLSTGFQKQNVIEKGNLELNNRFYPQSPGDFRDAFKSSESTSTLASGFRASESKFIRKPHQKATITKNIKEKKNLPQWNPTLTKFDDIHNFVAPGVAKKPEEVKIKQTPSKSNLASQKEENNLNKKVENQNEANNGNNDIKENDVNAKDKNSAAIEKDKSSPIKSEDKNNTTIAKDKNNTAIAKDKNNIAIAKDKSSSNIIKGKNAPIIAKGKNNANNEIDKKDATNAKDKNDATNAKEQNNATNAIEKNNTTSTKDKNNATNAIEKNNATSAKEKNNTNNASNANNRVDLTKLKMSVILQKVNNFSGKISYLKMGDGELSFQIDQNKKCYKIVVKGPKKNLVDIAITADLNPSINKNGIIIHVPGAIKGKIDQRNILFQKEEDTQLIFNCINSIISKM